MSNNPIYSDFWLDAEKYSDYIDPSAGNTDEVFSIDLIQLASVRRIVSNYVDILTGESIPVFFKAVGDSYNIGGREIYITTTIKRRKDFDRAVGLALHEAAHTVLTEFDLLKTIPFNTPKNIWEFGKKNKILKRSLERFIKTIVNVIEDWYIDEWVMTRVPGYIGYYEASYNDCFNTPTIDQLLLSNEYKFPSLASYEFRIINFPNPLTDLQALPGLERIAKEIDITNISRLKTTKNRIELGFRVVQIVLENLQKCHESCDPKTGQSNPGRINVNAFFGPPVTSSKAPQPPGDKSAQKTDTDRTVQDVADMLAQRPKKDNDENKQMSSQVSKSSGKELSKEIKQAVDKQMHYVHGNVQKQELNPLQKNMLDLIEKHGIVLVYVPVPIEGNEAVFKVGCIVVKKLTMDLVSAGQEVFPMANFWKDEKGDIQPDAATANAVQKGIQLGSKLGRKLIIRREANPLKKIHKKYGKVNKRLLYAVGLDAEDVFEKLRIIKYNQGSLHITVDASTSMSGDKWNQTMTMCVAICKATSIVDNIHVTVSFRATKTTKGVEMPYIVQAYDSKRDKFSKVKKLFPFLRPCGCTPEGLAYGAIMDLFTESVPDEEDKYFLNISDGEPWFTMRSPITGQTFHYGDGNGVEHTRNQVAKIRRRGTHILSYYVQNENLNSDEGGHNTKKNFQVMYGRDARFLNVNSVTDLASSINELFLRNS